MSQAKEKDFFGKNMKPKNKSNKFKDIECHHCKKKGHVKRHCRKLKNASNSEKEREYIALSSCTCDVRAKQFINELVKDFMTPAKILVDNESSIKLASTDAFRPRTKHIDIRFHHIRQHIDDSTIEIEHVPSKINEADSLTKPVTKEKMDMCGRKYMVVE